MRHVRVEDVLCLLQGVVLALFAGLYSAVRTLSVSEDQYWLFTFMLFPATLIIFIVSLRYALGIGETESSRVVKSILGVARDWLPFALFLIFYSSFQLHVWSRVSPRNFDAELMAIDRSMLGETPAIAWQRFITRGRTEILALAYFLHLVFPPFLAFLVYRKDFRLFRSLLLAVLLAGSIGNAGYALVPAIGPGSAYPEQFRVDLGGTPSFNLVGLMDKARAPRDVFPSLHTAVSAIVLWYGFRRSRLLGSLLLLPVLLNWISTMYLRYHYFIDVIAGWITALLSIALAALLLRLEERWRAVEKTPDR